MKKIKTYRYLYATLIGALIVTILGMMVHVHQQQRLEIQHQTKLIKTIKPITVYHATSAMDVSNKSTTIIGYPDKTNPRTATSYSLKSNKEISFSNQTIVLYPYHQLNLAYSHENTNIYFLNKKEQLDYSLDQINHDYNSKYQTLIAFIILAALCLLVTI